MIVLLVAAALVASLALGRLGPLVGRWLGPAASVRLLTVSALATALATGFVLCVTAFAALARVPVLAALGQWSPSVVASREGVPVLAGLLAAAVVVVLAGLVARQLVTSGADLVAADATCRRLGPGVDGLVVVDDAEADAFVMPGVRGRVVVSTAMLSALAGDERRVLLAHEQAHLRHRHHLYIQLTELAARADPALRPLVPAVRDGVERWADEEAATTTGDRRVAARAVARAALVRHDTRARGRGHRLALGAAGAATVARVQALLAEPVRPRSAPLLLLAVVVAAAPAAALTSALVTERSFEIARAALVMHP